MEITKSRTIQENPTLSQSDINAGYEFREYDDHGKVRRYIESDAVNRHLRSHDIALKEKESPYAIPEAFRPYSIAIMEHLLGQADPGQFENHRICGLYSDIRPDSKTALIGYTEYFDMLATFYSFPYIYRNDNHAIEFKGSSYIYNEFGVLFPLSLCMGANPIGANTVAVTSDNKILVNKQGDDAYVNAGKLMPSGSGSASWHDYIDDKAQTLQDIVRHCAEWKMRNECGIPDDIASTTEVLGMCRVPIAMKPDFYCLTILDATWSQLESAGAKVHALIDAEDDAHISDALIEYVDSRNRKEPGSVSIQLFLNAQLISEICR